jgi:hypothetical protein
MKNYLLIAIVAMGIVSCTNDENLNTNDQNANNTPDNILAKAGTVTGQYGTYDDPDYQWAFMANNIWNWNNSGSDHGQYIWYNSIDSWGVKAYTTFGSNPAYSEVKSYGSIVFGSHYGRKSKNTNGFPIQVKSIKSKLNAQWNVRTENTDSNSNWNASYDIWFDPSSTNNGANKYEIMIWTKYQNQYPIGKKVVNKESVAGVDYEIWEGSNGINQVITFRPINNGTGKFSASLKTYIDYAVNTRKWMTDANYLTSIQAGFEICTAGKGAADNQKANFVTDKFYLGI